MVGKYPCIIEPHKIDGMIRVAVTQEDAYKEK
jgi:hypothetical protein